MFSSDLTIDDFIVCRFKVKGNKREFIGARNTSAFLGGHTKSKADAYGNVNFNAAKEDKNYTKKWFFFEYSFDITRIDFMICKFLQ